MIKIKIELPFYKNNFKLVQSERFQFIGLVYVKELALADVQVTLSQNYHRRM